MEEGEVMTLNFGHLSESSVEWDSSKCIWLDYTARKESLRGASSFRITHELRCSRFVKRQFDHGRVMFGCAIFARNTACKQFYQSKEPHQIVEWDGDVVGQESVIEAIVVVTEDFSHTFSKEDEVPERWIGKCVHFPKGTRLACTTVALPLLSAFDLLKLQQKGGLLKYRVDGHLQNGGFYVAIESTRGGRIDVCMATDLYEFMNGDSTGGELYRSVMAHFLTSAIWAFRGGISGDDKSDFISKHHRVAHLLGELIGKGFLDEVGSTDFQPDRVATRLVPLVFGESGERRLSPFLEYEAEKFDALRSSLIEEKGSEAQLELLEACLGRESFFSWVELKLSGGEIGQSVPEVLSRNLAEEDFNGMNDLVEQEACQLWSDVPLIVACRASFWGMVTVNHIEKGLIQPSYLACSYRSSKSGVKCITGVERIKRAIERKDNKAIDDVTRTILRKLSGLPEERGVPRSVSCDCPFGRAWWRQRILNEMLLLTEGNRQAISYTLYASKTYWEKLMMLPQMEVSKSKPSRFGDSKVRTAFIWALSDYVGICDYKKLFDSSGLIDKCTRRFTRMSLEREFGVFEIDELKSIIKEEVIEPEHRANLKVGRS